RQAAVAELAARHALREDEAARGPDLPGAASTDALSAWACAPTRPPPAWAPVLLVVLSAATVTGLGLWIKAGEPPPWLGGTLVMQAVLGWALRRRVLHAIGEVEPRARDLALAASLVARIEAETFTAPALAAVQERLAASGLPASAEIARLTRLVELLTSRQNQLFGPLSVLLFWATHLAWAVDRWRQRAGRAVPGWIAALGELEALAALATYTAEHPGAVFPTFVAGAPRLEASELSHPLLPPDSAIGNDIALGGAAPHLLIISGSNMSGKSTWLRAVGLNVVFAHAGAPVSARAMSLTPLQPAGTLRVQDSLQSGRSRFFAEITKLRQIVEQARTTRTDGPATLFLIDELLAGTNSHDRRQGAEGVLRGLLALGALGMATTHDLALTDLATALGGQAANHHFADRFEQGGLEFDYRLRAGVVGTSNALALMRSVGLEV
ncbi:MAG: DNA mismatch repair protein MutS, partial [Acidobacteriota bacterium]